MFNWNKNCWWSCSWPSWGHIVEIKILTKLGPGVRRVQRRSCFRCHKIEERRIYGD